MDKHIFNAKAISLPDALRNAKEWPKTYTCKFIEPGLVSYQDCGAGVALVTKETLDKMLNSIIGKPVIIAHSDVTPANMKEHAIGYVTNAYFEPHDGWYYCSFLITDDKGHEVVRNGASVSCGYKVLNTRGGGEWHAIPYNEEIIDGEYEHLALVFTPRYEDSRILVNSKGKKIVIENNNTQEEEKPMFGFLKKKNDKGELEKIKTDLSTHFVKLENGKKVSLKELIDLRNSQKKQEENTHAVEDVIETEDGVEIKISELVDLHNEKAGKEVDPNSPPKDKWNEGCTCDAEKGEEHTEKCKMNKKNAAEGEEEEKKRIEKEKADEDSAKSDKEASKKKNEQEEADKKKKEEEETIKKQNEKKEKDEAEQHFIKLNSLAKQGQLEKEAAPQTLSERVARGANRYGKK